MTGLLKGSQKQKKKKKGSPRHATEEVVLSGGVFRVLDRALPFASRLGRSPLAMSPHTCKERGNVAALCLHNLEELRVRCMRVLCVYPSHRGASGCESGPGAKVCPPRWIEEPAAQAESTPSPAGSERKKRNSSRLRYSPAAPHSFKSAFSCAVCQCIFFFKSC